MTLGTLRSADVLIARRVTLGRPPSLGFDANFRRQRNPTEWSGLAAGVMSGEDEQYDKDD